MTQPHAHVRLVVRRAALDDVDALRELRLRALWADPQAFGSTYERELERTSTDWACWITPDPSFFLCTDDGGRVGLAAGYHDSVEPGTVMLAAVWIEPSARGRGGVALLVDAFVRWAATKQPTAVKLWVVATNDVARRAYERCGFEPTGQTLARTRDGVVELEMSLPFARLAQVVSAARTTSATSPTESGRSS